jgi:hypothetical protein
MDVIPATLQEQIEALAALPKLDPRELRESGLLYHVNEAVLWPLGLALTTFHDKGTGEYMPYLVIQDFGEIIHDPDPVLHAK